MINVNDKINTPQSIVVPTEPTSLRT